jgi:WD40 repeat protein
VAKGTDRYILRGHKGPVSAAAFHMSGSVLATGSHDGTARLWDPATGKETTSMTGHNQGVTAVAISADAKVVLTGSTDRTLKAWDASNGKEFKSLGEFTGEALALAPEKFLAGGTNNNSVRLWDITGPRPVEARLLAGTPLSWIKALAYAPDGRSLVAAGNDGTVVFWNTTTGKEVRRWSLPGGVVSLAYAGDGRHLVFLLADGTFAVFRLAAPPERRPRWTG